MAEPRQFLTLGVADERYAVPVAQVREILALRPIARLPRSHPALLGVIDMRGRSAPALDLRALLGLPPAPDDAGMRIVVLSLAGDSHASGRRAVGLKADRVFEVTALDGDTIEPPPRADPRWRAETILGLGRRGGAFVAVLDLERLLRTPPEPAPAEAAAPHAGRGVAPPPTPAMPTTGLDMDLGFGP